MRFPTASLPRIPHLLKTALTAPPNGLFSLTSLPLEHFAPVSQPPYPKTYATNSSRESLFYVNNPITGSASSWLIWRIATLNLSRCVEHNGGEWGR